MKVFLISLIGVAALFAVIAGIIFMENKTAAEQSAAVPELKFNHVIELGGNRLIAALADNDQTRQQGLSGQTKLGENDAVIFDFSNSVRKRPGFWMKDMMFPLDIIWVKNNSVVDIARDVPAPNPGTKLSDLQIYFPPSDIDEVIEVNAGWCAQHNVGVGSVLSKTI